MIIDCHNHVGEPWGTKDRQTPEELIQKMDRAKIDKAVVFSFRYENFDNHYTYEAVKKFPDRLIGFAMAAPWTSEDFDSVLREEIENYDFKGIKIHANAHSYRMDSISTIAPIFDIAKEKDIPVIAYSGDEIYAMPQMFIPIAEAYPEVNIIMAHSGFMMNAWEAVEVAMRCPNIYLVHESSCSGLPRPGSCGLAPSIFALGAERVLMGTDTPYWDFEVQLKKIEVSVPDSEDRKKIMSENIAKMLKLNID